MGSEGLEKRLCKLMLESGGDIIMTALVSIFDLKMLKKRKVLSSADAQARSYVSMAFSADNQLLLT
ncbi:hypothetical protein DVH05_017170 [Phytophthora capsici]|nr:hypothetical protein DVH05_017170 [Phytophthora capsici]